MPHLHVVRGRDGGHTSPLGWATAPGGVEVADIDCPVHNQVAYSHPSVLALAGGHRDTGDRPHVLHPAPVVVPAARLLEPAQVDVLDSLTKLNRLSGGVALVGIAHE